jgi:hypothetical protein
MDKEMSKIFREVAENARREAAELANSCHPAETTAVFWADGTKIAELPPLKRWNVAITYDHGYDHGWPGRNIEVIHRGIEELSELHDLIERGPNFYSIAKIEIVINPAIDRKEMLAE